MDNYLIDRETLGQFVDELIKQKPLDVNNTEELNNLREESIKALDKAIGVAIFSHFTEEQNTEFNQLLDRDAPEEDYQAFFDQTGLDLEKITTEAMQKFAQEFLEGGQND